MARLLSQKSVTEKTSLCRAVIYRMVGRGEFPKPVKISERRVAWLESDVDKWIEEQFKGQEDLKGVSMDDYLRGLQTDK